MSKTYSRRAAIALAFAVSAGLFNSAAAQSSSPSRESLALPGCSIWALTANANASFVLAGCESLIGLHFLLGLDSKWQSAAGGEYASGPVYDVALTSQRAYAIANDRLLASNLPSDSAWNPSWVEIPGFKGNSSLAAIGRYLIVGNGSSLHVIDSENSSTIGVLPVPDGAMVVKVAAAPGYLYLLAAPVGSQQRRLYRTTVAAESGRLGGSWFDCSNSTGLPSGELFWNVFAHSDTGALYLGTRDESVSGSDMMHVSTDHCDSFQPTGVAAVANSMCFNDNIVLMGTRLSIDGGQTWKELIRPGFAQERGRFEDHACVISQTTADVALIGTNEGVDRTRNLANNTGSPDWVTASSGLEGTLVYDIAQAPEPGGRIVLGTSAGIAMSESLGGSAVIWTYPICPGTDCAGGRYIAFDTQDSSIVYYGSESIQKGVIRRAEAAAKAPIVAWSEFAAKPQGSFDISVFKMFDAAPQALVVGYRRSAGAVGGGLYFYGTESPDAPRSAHALEGLPVSAFLPASNLIMFAALGVSGAESAQHRGIYRSSDGGSSWTKMTDPDLPELVWISDFSYDANSAVLYAASVGAGSESGTVYRLPNPLSGSDWEAPGNFASSAEVPSDSGFNFSSVAVQPATGVVYAAVGADILVSTDHGQSYSLYLHGMEREVTRELKFIPEPALPGTAAETGGAGYHLLQASSAGIYEIDRMPSVISCRIEVVPRRCSKGVLKGRRCRLRAVVNSGAATVQARFEKSRNGLNGWSKAGRQRTVKSGAAAARKLVAKRTLHYRAVFDDPYACVTASAAVIVRTKRKRRRRAASSSAAGTSSRQF